MPKRKKESGTKEQKNTAPLTTADLAAILHLIQPLVKLGIGDLALSLASLRARTPARTAVKPDTQLTGDDLANIAKLLRSSITLPVERRPPANRKEKSDIDDLFKETGKRRGRGGYSGPRMR